MAEPDHGYRFAADIGGTFTDIACLSPDAVLATRKLPSTPDDYARAILEGISSLAAELARIPGGAFDIELKGVGAFGDAHRSHTLWAGLEPSERLNVLAGRCKSAAERARGPETAIS